MAREFTLGLTIFYSVRDAASKSIKQITTEQERLERRVDASQMAMRKFGQSAAIIGVSMLVLSSALAKSNNATAQGVAKWLGFAGALLTTIGTIAHTIVAVSELIQILRKYRIAALLAQAFSGPAGWAMLAAGLAVGGAALAASGAMDKGFALGGTVPGPIGAPVRAIVHGGEEISRPGSRGGGPSINVYVGAFMGTESDMRALTRIIAEQLKEMQRTSRRGV